MSRVSQTQMKKLLELLSEEGVLVNGKVMYTNTNKQSFWKRIAMQLNAVDGGVYKNTWKWCKMWADWKNKTKKKANILLRRKSYSLEHPSPSLTNLELRLLKMINYPVDDKADAMKLEMVVNKVEAEEDTVNDMQMQFTDEDYSEINSNKDELSDDDDKTIAEYYKRKKRKYCHVNDVLGEDFKFEELEEPVVPEQKVKVKEKSLRRKRLSLEQYRINTKLALEKDRVQQKNEELRLRAIELKLKGEELRLKEIEMNKINYLTNIEEEKLKCFRDISSSLKELLERSRTGNFRFHNGM